MTDLGQAWKFLGINIKQTLDCIHIHQEGYICQILTRFETMDAINASTPLDCNIDLYNNKAADKEVDVK
jgi:hypothetical protein